MVDGHGRVAVTTERVRLPTGAIEARNVRFAYHPTGEVTSITRDRSQCLKPNECGTPSDAVVRTIQYDSQGRMKANTDPNTGTWRYVYNVAGDLIGTSDARGCGVNYSYDAAGRLTEEDYWPCEAHHEPYDGSAEVLYSYDQSDSEVVYERPDFPKGRLVAVEDRAAKTVTGYDQRGRVVQGTRFIHSPQGASTEQSFTKTTEYDAADRPTLETTGSRDHTAVVTSYTRRGAVDVVQTGIPTTVNGVPTLVGASTLVGGVKRDADGLVTEIKYGGDPVRATTSFDYDDLRRLRNLTTYRAQPSDKMLLQDEQYIYDRVGNPVEIRDWRSESEWDPGFEPVSRKMVYDDLYRLTRIDYQYHPTGSDVWVDPYAAELSDNTRPQPPPHEYRANPKRVMRQTWSYDWLGNTVASTDDASLFYDRSLGTIGNEGYRLTSASQAKADGNSHTIGAAYDPAGYLTWMTVSRPGAKCGGPNTACPAQRYDYEWDEVGRLTKATRKDDGAIAAELTYAYDASDQRVRKTAGSRHSIYVFGSLELRSTEFTTEYSVSDSTEVPYLFGHGVRLGRLTYGDSAGFGSASRRVFLELGDHLGSTAVVLDLESGELVERSTAFAYGAAESHYRPERWGEFREDYRFTGKEDDIEVGLIYFGARYLNPQLGRWISADPLAVHAPGKADLNLYAYVHGKVLLLDDPTGLDPRNGSEGTDQGPPSGQADPQPLPDAPADPKPETKPPPAPTGPSVGAQGTGSSDPHAQAAQQKAEQQKQQTVNTAMQKLPPSLRKPDQLTPLWKGDQVGGWLYRTSPWKSEGDFYLHDTSGNRLGYAGEKQLIRDYTVDVAGPPLVMGAAKLGAGMVSRLVLRAPTVRAGVSGGLDAALKADVAAALEEANAATTTLYHGGVLRGGAVEAGNFSTTTSLEHATQYAAMRGGQVYQFKVPNSVLSAAQQAGGMQKYVDTLAGSTGSASEIRFIGEYSLKLNPYLVPPPQ